ncbi:MAG: nickel-type superoxide dismutase maturation protease [Cyanobacteria bacterium SBLK]|nr:nickel-type superoxide dismutase maturation protease [Cyanobacteria bacterium SBLK]
MFSTNYPELKRYDSVTLARSPRELLLWLFRKRRRFRISGNSMLPLLKPGEEILIDLQAYRNTFPRVGDLVIARHPQKPELKIVKRVAWVVENGDCFLQGDNPKESTDSRTFGVVRRDYILGKATSRFG